MKIDAEHSLLYQKIASEIANHHDPVRIWVEESLQGLPNFLTEKQMLVKSFDKISEEQPLQDELIIANSSIAAESAKLDCDILLLDTDQKLLAAAKKMEAGGYIRAGFILGSTAFYVKKEKSSSPAVAAESAIQNDLTAKAEEFERLRKEYVKLKNRSVMLESFYKTAGKRIAELEAAYTQITQSRAWRLTGSYRRAGAFLKHGFSKQEKQLYKAKVDKSCHNALLLPKSVAKSHQHTLDIIICVYNALEDVKLCIDSVLNNTSDPFQIILVDDNSAAPTREYLEEVAQKYAHHIQLIQNDKPNAKHGYTYAVNIGLRASKADFVVCLNSDTIVPAFWADRMIECAQSDPRIGVVGPLSNTASWQSIPEITGEDGDWAHNVLPEGYDVERMGEEIAQNSGVIYPKVRLLNGFCLMLTRATIKKIGYMDEENFGRGFSEEDDYNSRCAKAGICLAVADNVYVYHSQSKSYSNERRMELCKLSGEALRKKHGDEYINACCQEIYHSFAMDSIRLRAKMMFERNALIEEGRKLFAGKKILVLLPAASAGGGGNVVIQEAQSMMKMGVQVSILNLYQNKEAFEKSYPGLDIPCIYVNSYHETSHVAEDFDAVCGTLYSTMAYCEFSEMSNPPRVAYYIQDYEPYFFDDEFSDGYQEAKASYTLLPGCVNVTKTLWNRNEVRSQTGADCTVIGPSVNIDLFRVRKHDCTSANKIIITAMVRPHSPRRGPEMTWTILRKIKKEFGEIVEIRVFGADPEREDISRYFFDKQSDDFDFTNYGLLTPEQSAALLAESDIFVDYSTFQAMGLTAMEAMASGCAVIVPVHGGSGSFAENEKNSLMIDTLDEDACYEGLKRLVEDSELRTALARQAYSDMCGYYPEKSAFNFLKAIFKS